MSLSSVASEVVVILRRENVRSCIVGGLAVSARCNPRFTRDIDIAVAVESDAQAEILVNSLSKSGLRLVGHVEQEAVGRMAMARLESIDGLSIDLLIASSGIESEVVSASQILEIIRGVLLPVARIGHLIALKLLSVGPGRETDAADLRSLAAIATDDEWILASQAIKQIEDRGFARGRNLVSDLDKLRR